MFLILVYKFNHFWYCAFLKQEAELIYYYHKS